MQKLFKVLTLTCLLYSSAVSSTLAIGFRWNTVFMWRYWQIESGNEHEKITFFNADSTDTRLSFALAKMVDDGLRVGTVLDSSFILFNPEWKIPARSCITTDAPRPTLAPNTHYLYHVYKDTEPHYSLIDVASSKPDSMIVNCIQTTEGFNESGGPSSHRWWEQQSLFVKSGDTATATLRIQPSAEKDGSIVILNSTQRTLTGISSLEFIGASSASPFQELNLSQYPPYNKVYGSSAQGWVYALSAVQIKSAVPRYCSLTFTVRAPKVSAPTFCYLDVRDDLSVSRGSGLPLMFIVIP